MNVCKVYMCACVDTKQEEGTAGCGWSEWRPVHVWQDSWWRLCVISCRLLLHRLFHCLGLSLAAEEENKERDY